MRQWIGAAAFRGGCRPLLTGPVLAVTLLALALPATTLAQSDIKAVEPYIVTVTADKAPLRCSNGLLFYSVRDLKAGESLRVNGEGPGWVRVEYTPGMRAYVNASEVEAARDGQSAKLTKPSRLLAVSGDGKQRPWWPLDLDADIPAGTTFHIVEPYKTPDNVIDGYYVDAPAKARGYVKTDHVRKASPEESARHTGAAANKPAEPAAKPGQPTPAPTTPKPAPTPPTPVPGGVAPAPTAVNPPPQGTPPGFNPVTSPPGPAPGATPPAAATPSIPTAADNPPSTGSVTMTNTPPPPPPPVAPPPPKKDEEVEQIRTVFEKVMHADGDAEVASVLGMFERKIGKLGTTPGDAALKTSLEQRLSVLKFRQEVIDERDKAKQVRAGRQSEMQRIALVVANAQKQAIYNIVGRIQPSTVYDGKRGLPLMYRVESADALSPRTVGYIIPTEGIELLTKIGKVCGVLGDNRFDNSLQLNIVAPRRIDVLDVGGTSTSPGNTAPATQPPADPAPSPQPAAAPSSTSSEPEK